MKEKNTFTLIEMVIALAIFVTVFGGTMSMISGGFLSMRKSRTSLVALNLIESVLDEHLTWDDIKELDANPWTNPDNGPVNGSYTHYSSPVTLNDTDFALTIDVADGPVYGSDLKEITVTASWDAGARNISIGTLVANFKW